MKIEFLILFFTIIVHVNCGILDWFRSKPSWVSKVDKYPLVEAFEPYGLRVSIGDIQGLQKFNFHGKLNQCFGRGENGTFNGYVTSPTNYRWVYVDENIHLKIGDALHFWISVTVNGEEHRFNKNVQIINNLIPKPQDLYLINSYPTEPTTVIHGKANTEMCPCDQMNMLNNFASTSSMFNPIPTFQPTPSINSENMMCKSQVDSLTEVLLFMLKDEILNTNLVLVGIEVTNRSAMDEVVSILTDLELFDLIGKIKLAYYLKCGIYFDMSSIVDKKRILFRASIDLLNSQYKFIEPEQAQCNIPKDDETDVDVRIKDDNVKNSI